MLINSTNLNSLFNGFSTAFNEGFKGAKSSYRDVAMVIPSVGSDETYGWLGQLPRFREWIGDRVIHSLAAHTYTIANKKFEQTISVDRDKVEDDKYGLFAPLFTELGRSAASFPDELVFDLLASGFSQTCYDGQYFFDTDHPVLDEDGQEFSVANTDGGTGTPWFLLDTSRAIKPLVFQERVRADKLQKLDQDSDENVFMKDEYLYGLRARANAGFGLWQLAWGSKQTLNAANYEKARIALTGLKGDFNARLGIMPDLLVVPPSIEGAARKILKSERLENGETNQWAGTAEVLITPWLA